MTSCEMRPALNVPITITFQAPGAKLVMDAGMRCGAEGNYEDFRSQCGLDCCSTGCRDGCFLNLQMKT